MDAGDLVRRAGGAEPDGGARAGGLGLGGECVPLWGRATTRGHRKAMEDASVAVPPFADVPVRMLASARELEALGRGPGGVDHDASAAMHLFGVYDGHGGSKVADYCGDRIHVVLREAVTRAAAAATGLEGSGELAGIQELWEKAFCESFQRVDNEVSGQASRFLLSDGVGEARCEPVAAQDVGSTAVVALVCSSHVIVANCGDSRVVLCRGKESVALSVDHKPDREDERERIEAAGGFILNYYGHRVVGVLAMSRSIGDRCIKPYVIPKPEVRVIPRTSGDNCLILASDGLWDVISKEDACKAARLQILRWHRKNDVPCFGEAGKPTISDPASQAAADYLVKLALFRGSTDNITVIVIDLKRWNPQLPTLASKKVVPKVALYKKTMEDDGRQR